MTLKKVTGIFLTILLLSVFPGSARADDPTKVAVIPFKMNTERDLSFLRDGIVDMLTSRLSWGDKVVVIQRESTERIVRKIAGPINEKVARKIGAALKADYVLFGSLTIFGESVSIDAKMIDVSGTKPAVAVFNQSRGMDSVIPKVNAFATEVNEKCFGRVPLIRHEAPRQVASRAPFPDIYGHPEKLLGEGSALEHDNRMQTSTINPDFIVASSRSKSGSFWKSRNFKEYIKSISIGDIDGDNKQEIVFISQNSIFVYKNVERRFIKVKEIAGDEPNVNFIGVDVADINGNGKAEIFVTNLNTLRDSLESFVLEWEAGDFVTVTKNNNWYYRVLELPMQGTVLLGEKRGISDPFIGGIYELSWINGKYEPTNRVRVPRDLNVFSFAVGDVLNDGTEMILAFNEDDYLQILTKSGSKEWKSAEHYGGSVNYLDIESRSGESEKDRLFLSQRIFMKDLDRDGKKEVIVVQNHAGTSRLFKRYRSFSSSQIVSLSWNGLGLALNWKTRKIHGYVSDFAIGDFDNDGQEELVAAVVMERGASFVAKAKSAIISYDLAIPKTQSGQTGEAQSKD